MRGVVILGSTGSIGVSALRVVEAMPQEFRVLGLAAYSNYRLLREQAARFKPEMLALFDADAARQLRRRVNGGARHLPPGLEGLCEMVAHKGADLVVLSVVGGVGFAPLLAALKAGKTVALANKEPMVMAGEQFMREAERWRARILPVDSEPSAVFQCLSSHPPPRGGLRGYGSLVRRAFLTASGGAFYRSKGRLDKVTPRQALAHPTWKMGRKITVDCATLMNKGFETIELMNLFGLALGQIEVLIHPQSVVHSAVEFQDGSVLAQMSPPDMRLPIQYAMTWPRRARPVIEPLDLLRVRSLSFDKPDFRRFPCLSLAREAAKAGGSMPAVLNAADEVAVEAFLDGRIRFTDIPRVVEAALRAHGTPSPRPSFAEVVEVDAWARLRAQEEVGKR